MPALPVIKNENTGLQCAITYRKLGNCIKPSSQSAKVAYSTKMLYDKSEKDNAPDIFEYNSEDHKNY